MKTKELNIILDSGERMTVRECLKFKAKIADQAKRYEDLFEYMQQLATFSEEFSLDERALLVKSFKTNFTARRQALQVIQNIQNKLDKSEVDKLSVLREEYNRIHREMQTLIFKIFHVLQTHLLPQARDVENIAFYYQMVGDYNRYLAMLLPIPAAHQCNIDYMQHAFDAYKTGCELALTKLSAVNSVRLALVLNLAKFFYYLANSPEYAIGLINATYKDIIAFDAKPDNTAMACLDMMRRHRAHWLHHLKNAGDNNYANS